MVKSLTVKAMLTSSRFETALWSAIRPTNSPDAELMAFSTKSEYVVFKRDLDFASTLTAIVGEKSCVLQVRAEDIDANAIGTNRIVALRQTEAEGEAGVSIRRSRIPVAGGGAVRPTVSRSQG